MTEALLVLVRFRRARRRAGEAGGDCHEHEAYRLGCQ